VFERLSGPKDVDDGAGLHEAGVGCDALAIDHVLIHAQLDDRYPRLAGRPPRD
jgi:hypothetical protein